MKIKIPVQTSTSATLGKFTRITLRPHNDIKDYWVVGFDTSKNPPMYPEKEVVVSFEDGKYYHNSSGTKGKIAVEAIKAFKDHLAF